MGQYAVRFSKQGFICYTSHLDLLRLFKRAFKKAGIKLAYSQGFNPHPKMGFAQPLSLGYSSICEYLEFETAENYDTTILRSLLEDQMPEGIALHTCEKMDGQKKSLAARTYEAEYIIGIPMGMKPEKEANDILSDFLAQEAIMVPKKKKKSKQLKDVDIKDKIRFLNGVYEGENLIITANLDSGSDSNLSPELLIQALVKFMGIETERAEMNVLRTKIIFE